MTKRTPAGRNRRPRAAGGAVTCVFGAYSARVYYYIYIYINISIDYTIYIKIYTIIYIYPLTTPTAAKYT